MEGAYVFRVRFRLTPSSVDADPDTFETVVRLPAGTPGDEAENGDGDWRFFEEGLWRGNLTDERAFRAVAERWLSVDVVDVRFSELVVDEAYHAAWTDAVAAEVERYNATTAREVRHQHLGSSLRLSD